MPKNPRRHPARHMKKLALHLTDQISELCEKPRNSDDYLLKDAYIYHLILDALLSVQTSK